MDIELTLKSFCVDITHLPVFLGGPMLSASFGLPTHPQACSSLLESPTLQSKVPVVLAPMTEERGVLQEDLSLRSFDRTSPSSESPSDTQNLGRNELTLRHLPIVNVEN